MTIFEKIKEALTVEKLTRAITHLDISILTDGIFDNEEAWCKAEEFDCPTEGKCIDCIRLFLESESE